MNTATFALGQRWISNTESELGLGAIMQLDQRTVGIFFPATGESRTYTQKDAPLTRVQFDLGDTVKSQDGWSLVVEAVSFQQGVVLYQGTRVDTGEAVSLSEVRLDHHLRLNQPQQRLFSLQLDVPKWFELRQQSLQLQHQYQTSSTIGLAGARIELIPHQLHIAAEVGRRHAPRVLLADEVGLGKTIEAALIIHQQLRTGKATRVLIMVPDALLHQWLVEMRRRVNLAFSLFDEERCQSLSDADENPFEQEQLVLCGLDWLTHDPVRQQQALAAGWDILVVDEAHHLVWSPQQPSSAYQCVETFSQRVPGVLLLTATPDQLGHESHFARLRLLDPSRFHDYEQFLAEESHYAALADAVAPLLEQRALDPDDIQTLTQLAPTVMQQHTDLDNESARMALLHTLIDCHGTGRQLFRNRRASISGFPQRQPHFYPLASDDSAKIEWLITWLEARRGNASKVLLICAQASMALQLAEIIRVRTGIRQAVFHEGMSIVERDKAAHYFADSEQGAQILLCSEIGSEGRNFQFAHDLVLYDVPVNPDLLEQRIGRLDRIGQTQDIQIHIPFVQGTAQEVLVRWYHEGLNAFTLTCPVASAVTEQVAMLRDQACSAPDDDSVLASLLQQTRHLRDELMATLDAGRDRLLELNASGWGRIDHILEDIIAQDSSPELPRFMGRMLDAIGVQQEEKGPDYFVLMPTESMVSQLPGLDHEGMTVTYRRRVATTLEHVQFISWDHPLVQNVIDLLLTDVMGKASVGFATDPDQPKGAYWLQALFVVTATAPAPLQLGRFLPPVPISININAQGELVEDVPAVTRPAGQKLAMQLVNALETQLKQALDSARAAATQQAQQTITQARDAMRATLTSEQQRLLALREHNPAIREEEIAFIQRQQQALEDAIAQAEVTFDAVRLVVNNP